MALTVSARSKFTGPSTPALIKGAAICAAVGIGSSLTEYADYGKWLTVAGVLLSIWGLHRFGRLGPDAAIVFELAAPRKKKKRKSALAEPRPEEPAASPTEPSASTAADEREGEAER